MRYKIQQFVKTTDGESPIGKGDEWQWIDKDGQFNFLPNAIDFAEKMFDHRTKSRIIDTTDNDIVVWGNY